MKKSIILLLMLFSLSLVAQDKNGGRFGEAFKQADKAFEGQQSGKPEVKPDPAKVQEAVANLQQYYDISEEGTLYPKGTFPVKVDTTKILVIYSSLDKVTAEDGTEFTSPKVLQKVMYVVGKPNSFTIKSYLDENKRPINKELIIWQTKEFPKK